MLHPAQKIASFFVAKKLIPAQDYEWAVYGLQRRLLAAVFYPILFLIGLLVSDVYSTVLFFVVFTSLRHRVGGHHAGSAIAFCLHCGQTKIFPVFGFFITENFSQ